MKSILIKTYKKIRFIIYSILKISLNKSELQGELNYFTFLKFKYSYIMDLPFNVGRTNRGLNFDNKPLLIRYLKTNILLCFIQLF